MTSYMTLNRLYQTSNKNMPGRDVIVKIYHWNQGQFWFYHLFNLSSVMTVKKNFIAIALKSLFLHFKIICDLLLDLTMTYFVIYNMQIHVASKNWNILKSSAKILWQCFRDQVLTHQEAGGNKSGIGIFGLPSSVREYVSLVQECQLTI